jgi:PTS system cellobiose-specific IIA component
MDMEISCMQMILHSGNSRGDSSEAIECLKEKQFDKATELLENAKSELLLAQKTHAMTNDEAIPMNLLLVHAEDHVASSEVVLTMANELFVVYSILNEGKVY